MDNLTISESDNFLSIENLKKESIWIASNPEKIPISIITGKPAQWKNPDQLATFDAVQSFINGREGFLPAFILKKEHGITFIDLDDCFDGNHIKPFTQKILDKTGASFTEKSRSGKGVHILIAGNIPRNFKSSDIEMYDSEKVVTLTFNYIGERTAIQSNQQALDILCKEYVPPIKELRKKTSNLRENCSREKILFYIQKSPHHNHLFEEGFTETIKQRYKNDKSHSSADFDFMCFLAKYTRNEVLAIEIFKESKLWDDTRFKKKGGEKYLFKTFEQACATVELNEEKRRIPWQSYYFLDLYEDGKLWVYHQPPIPHKALAILFKKFNREEIEDWDYEKLKEEAKHLSIILPEARAVSSEIHKAGIVKDGKSKHHHLLVRFPSYEDGTIHELAIPSGHLHTDKNKVVNDLSSHGLYIRHEMDKFLLGYLLENRPITRGLVTDKIGWHDDIYILPDEQFGSLQKNHALIHLKKEKLTQIEYLESRGTFEDWMEHIGKYIKNNPALIFATGASFAPVLMNDLNIESGGFNFYGNSSVGKTSTIMVANSIWAAPKWKNTWRSTDNALEGLCCSHNDAFMALDELSQATSDVVGNSVYMISNETAKLRANRHGEMTEVKNWRTIFVSTGEESVEQRIKEFTNKVKAGQLIRVLDIPIQFNDSVKSSDGHYTLYHDLHGFRSMNELSKHFYFYIKHYYGTPIRAFLRQYIEGRNEKSIEILKHEYQSAQQLLEGYCIKQYGAIDAQVSRSIGRFAVVLVALEKAIRFGLLPMEYNKKEERDQALYAVTKIFDLWIGGRDGSGNLEEKEILKKISVFFNQHGQTNKFIDYDLRQEEIPNNTSGVFGYRKNLEDESMCWYITPNMLEEVCRIIKENYLSVRQILRKNGMLQLGTQEQGKAPRDTVTATPKSLNSKNRYHVVLDNVLNSPG